MKTILVITSDPDPHVEAVKQYLPADTNLIVLDPLQYAEIPAIILNATKPTHVGSFDGVSLEDIDIVWYRKPRYIAIGQYPVDSEYQTYVDKAIRSVVLAVLHSVSKALWVSDYWSVKKANDKFLQLNIAKKLGFQTLDTLITSSPGAAKTFIEKHRKLVVTKPISYGYAYTEDNEEFYRYFYATSLKGIPDIDLQEELQNLPEAPAIFQQEITSGVDIRVTMIGNRAYTCEIHKVESGDDLTDWREDILQDSLEYRAHELPTEIYQKCKELLDALGLNFGVIEFKMDAEGNYWFMEINPNGQWLFVEDSCPELEIAKGIADFFLQ